MNKMAYWKKKDEDERGGEDNAIKVEDGAEENEGTWITEGANEASQQNYLGVPSQRTT